MSRNVLNLDVLRINRTVILGGRERVLRSMSVDQFIQAEAVQAKIDAAEGNDRFVILMDVILEYIEDTTREELGRLDLGQLMALLAFVRGSDLSDEAASDRDAEGNGDPK